MTNAQHSPDAKSESTVPSSIVAVLIGAMLSAVISGALVIATAKAGISPGVSPLVVLIGWVVFGPFLGKRLKPFLALLQVTGSGGAAVSAGLIFTAPIMQISAAQMGEEVPPVDIVTTLIACISGSLMGWGFVGLAARRFLTDPRLPAPEAVACDQLIQTADQSPEDRPPISISLLPALLLGFLVRMLVHLKYLAEIAVSGKLQIASVGTITLPVPVSGLFFGIGAILTFPTAVLVFAGGLVNATTKAVSAEQGMPTETYRWVGGAAMVVAVVYSLINYALESQKIDRGPAYDYDESLLELSQSTRVRLMAAILAGAALLCLLLYRANISVTQIVVLGAVSLVLVSLLSGLGGLLSLQVGASASPVSGTVFMAMLVLSVTAVGLSMSGFFAIETLQPVLVASCVAIAAANDSSQDYKTIQLNGYKISSAFNGQFVGCIVGACTVPFSLSIAHRAFGLGTEELPCPQASFFGTVLTSLFDPDQAVPWGPVGAGILLGLLAVAIEAIGRRRQMVLSSLAFAVGIYLPAIMGIGILTGNLARVVATQSIRRSSHRGILAAAGLIAGDSFFSLLAGILIVRQFEFENYEAASAWPGYVSGLVLLAMFGLLSFTFADASRSQRS